MGLFVDIYNTVAKFFRPQEEVGDASKSVATNRLKLVLMQDRTNLTPKILEQMRSELIELLSRYVELDKELLDLNFEQDGNQVALMLSIPVIRAKDEDEIEAAIKAHKEALSDKTEESEEDSEEHTESDEDTENTEAEVTEASKKVVLPAGESLPTENNDEHTEEEKNEANKTDAIAKELQDVPKIIKKKKVSTPEEISSNNPFKYEVTEDLEPI